MVLQTNMSDILARIEDQNRLVKQEAGLSAAPAAVVHQLKSMNLPQQFKDMKLPDLPQAIKVHFFLHLSLFAYFINTDCECHFCIVSLVSHRIWNFDQTVNMRNIRASQKTVNLLCIEYVWRNVWTCKQRYRIYPTLYILRLEYFPFEIDEQKKKRKTTNPEEFLDFI